MADRKLTGSVALTELNDADLLMAVDVSDSTDGEAGTNKKITVGNLRTEMQDGVFDGNYDNLDNKPTLFDGDYDNLTNKPMEVSLSVGTTEPTSPTTGDLWVDTSA